MIANVFLSLSKIQNNNDNKEVQNKYQKRKKKKTTWSAFLTVSFYEQKLTVSFLVFNHQSEPDSPLLHIRQEGEKKATDDGILDNEAKIEPNSKLNKNKKKKRILIMKKKKKGIKIPKTSIGPHKIIG